MTVLGVALVTSLAGVALWVRYRPESRVPGAVALVGLAAGSVLTAAVQSPCDVETAYFCASEVVDPDDPDASFLLLDTVTHAYVDKVDPTNLRFSSIRMFASAIEAMTEGEVAALHVGGGGFSLPTWLSATRPGSRNVVLELDGALVEFVEGRFEPAPVERTIVGDARLSLKRAGDGFDVVVGDAFGGLAVPWHLTTVEFLEEISESLDESGFYVMNLIDHGDFDFLRAEIATASGVFPHVALVTVPERFDVGGNFMLVASKRPIPDERIVAGAAALDLEVTALTATALEIFVDDAAILTDDFAPVAGTGGTERAAVRRSCSMIHVDEDGRTSHAGRAFIHPKADIALPDPLDRRVTHCISAAPRDAHQPLAPGRGCHRSTPRCARSIPRPGLDGAPG